MITKSPLYKQIIISIGSNNVERVMAQSNVHVTNITRSLKDIKLEVVVDFIRFDNKDIIITTNKVVAISDLNIVDEYMKNLNDIDSSDIMSPSLPQSKLYLKILNILYFVKDNNLSLTSDIIERIIETSHIFNNIVLAFWLCVIKISPKSDMAVICVNIWNFQNSMKGKMLINRCFNIGWHITMTRGTDMNPGILHCKNCWK